MKLHLTFHSVLYCELLNNFSWIYISEILPEKGVFFIAGIHWLLMIVVIGTKLLPYHDYYIYGGFGVFCLLVELLLFYSN